MKRPFALLFLFLLATRLCHVGIVWVEEAYPATAAIQMLHGQTIYRDFWFDKPPLTPLLYLLWGARAGLALRVAGALFVLVCCWAAYRLGREAWSEREGMIAAALLGFFLTFDVPSAVMALAPDLVMLAPHIGAMYLAWRKRAFLCGAMAGVAMLVNPKGVFVVAACLVWCWRDWLVLAGGFAIVNVLLAAALAATGGLRGCYEQVWAWGAIYSRDTFVDRVPMEALRRTAAWMGFHAAIVVAAAWYWYRERSGEARRLAVWTLVTLAGVAAGWRFFPRYYFLLLGPVTIAAARGFMLAPRRGRVALSLLLLVPLARFGPRYAMLAADVVRGRETAWADVAMNRDSRAVADGLARMAGTGDTLLVWGYRPDIFLYTRMGAGTPFLDSQPLTGVIADRHLGRSDVSAPELAAANRRRLVGTRPTFIVDGLGGFNPALAITRYPDLAVWLRGYEETGRTALSVVYRLRR